MAADDLDNATSLLVLLALLLSLVALSQLATGYTTAYLAAPSEITSYFDAVDLAVHENESYDRDVSALQRLDDKIRLGGLLREIQRTGDDLREQINSLTVGGSDHQLKTSARLLWLNKRQVLRELSQKLDMLRMRFLVAYLGIIATTTRLEQAALKDKAESNNEKLRRPSLPHALTEAITKKPPPLRRITTQAIGHNDTVNQPHRLGWAGVVQELQRSPLLHKRHASIETAMKSPQTPRSPSMSPTDAATRRLRADDA